MNEVPWNQVRLGDAAEIIMGQAPPGDTVSENGVGLPFLQGNADFGSVHPNPQFVCRQPARYCKAGDMLISVRAPVGALNQADQRYAIGRGVAAIRFTKIDPGYGRYALRRGVLQLGRVAQGTTFEAVGRRELANIRIQSPAAEREQRRIADILDTLDDEIHSLGGIISKLLLQRSGALEELIGKHTNTECSTYLGKLLLRIDAGWSPLCDETSPPQGSWGVLKVSAVTSGRYNPAESKTLLPGMHPRPEIEVHDGDLIVCRANGVRQLVGVSAIVADTPSKLMLSDKTLRLVPDGALASSSYLHYFLTSSPARRQIEALLAGSSGQNNISQQNIRSIRISIPDLNEQDQVVHAINAIDVRIRSEENVLRSLRDLKQGLADDLLTGRVRMTDGGVEGMGAG